MDVINKWSPANLISIEQENSFLQISLEYFYNWKLLKMMKNAFYFTLKAKVNFNI